MVRHVEDFTQTGILQAYGHNHPESRFCIEFPDGEAYVGLYETAYDSDNSGELDIEMDHPDYDEFYRVEYEVVEIIQDGPRRFHDFYGSGTKDWLGVDYRDFPSRVTDLETGTVVYPPDNEPQVARHPDMEDA